MQVLNSIMAITPAAGPGNNIEECRTTGIMEEMRTMIN